MKKRKPDQEPLPIPGVEPKTPPGPPEAPAAPSPPSTPGVTGERTVDSDAYMRRARPVSEAEAHAAMDAFDAEILAAMKRHGIAELVMMGAKYVKGAKTPLVRMRQQGSLSNGVMMAGAMFNLLRREQDAAIDEAAGIGQPKPGKRKARA